MSDRRPYIVVVQDQEVVIREYVTLATSQENAIDNISNGFYITESESTTVDHLKMDIVRADLLDEKFAKELDNATENDEGENNNEG